MYSVEHMTHLPPYYGPKRIRQLIALFPFTDDPHIASDPYTRAKLYSSDFAGWLCGRPKFRKPVGLRRKRKNKNLGPGWTFA